MSTRDGKIDFCTKNWWDKRFSLRRENKPNRSFLKMPIDLSTERERGREIADKKEYFATTSIGAKN